jgi:hypothetical protein
MDMLRMADGETRAVWHRFAVQIIHSATNFAILLYSRQFSNMISYILYNISVTLRTIYRLRRFVEAEIAQHGLACALLAGLSVEVQDEPGLLPVLREPISEQAQSLARNVRSSLSF